jgi:cysteine desulfurase
MDNKETSRIYMDYQATTPVDKRVLEEMLPFFGDKFGNPHSRSHSYGWEAEEAVEKAREQVASLIKANESEIVFTSGATESNNLALKGVAYFHKNQGKNHIITVVTEHKCILNSCKHLAMEGFDVTYLPVQSNGLIDLGRLEEAINDKTILVSVMAVNNEIGVIQPLKEIGKICRVRGVFFHSDAAQGFGKIALDVSSMCLDLVSISGHKIYGPKGAGALYVGKNPRVRLTPIIDGGGQERGMRSGTLPTPLIVGLGRASSIANEEMEKDYKHIRNLADKFYNAIMDNVPQVFLNGDREARIPGNINLSFAGIEGESMMMAVKELAISSGSACTSASLETSYVLKAIGVDADLAHTSIRFGIGRFTTVEEVDRAAELIIKAADKLRKMSPLWDMIQAGVDLKSVKWCNVH